MENFWIELKETNSGYQILNCQVYGKHYSGFLNQKEQKREDGSTFLSKSANMRPCSYDKCNICHPPEKEDNIWI